MAKRLKPINLFFSLLLLAGIAGSSYEIYQIRQIQQLNDQLLEGGPFSGNDHAFNKKFAAAYQQGRQKDHKRAIQSYSQLLETPVSPEQQARIQFNIANNLFLIGLSRGLNEEGQIMEETKYAFSQARIAYEQALRLQPSASAARFNLSLLLSVMPKNMQGTAKEQSSMQLSNLPIGLP